MAPKHRLRFVVVDDNEEVRHLVGALLQLRHGWELVAEASDGMAAINIVSELQPDIVIMDIDMPRLNGIEATKQITSHVPQSRVIGFSSSTDAPHAHRHEGSRVSGICSERGDF